MIFRRRAKGNQITFVTIVLIILMMYGFKFILPQGPAAVTPSELSYSQATYAYAEDMKGSPISFIRKPGLDFQGFNVLVKRKDRRVEYPQEIYVFLGRGMYRRFVRQNPQ